MYIDVVPNRTSPPAILLRESYRDGNKVRKRTLLNLTSWPRDLVVGFRALLKGGTVIPAGQEALTIILYYRPSNHETAEYLERCLGKISQFAHSQSVRDGTHTSQGLS